MSDIDIDLDAIRARAEAATEGPWFQGRESHRYESARDVYSKREPEEPDSCDIATYVNSEEDAEFIANAREDVPALLDEVERLRADRDEQGRYLSVVDEFARTTGMSHDAVLEAVGVKADLDRAEATIARVRKLAASWDDVIAEERNRKRTWCAGMIEAAQSDLRSAIEGTDS